MTHLSTAVDLMNDVDDESVRQFVQQRPKDLGVPHHYLLCLLAVSAPAREKAPSVGIRQEVGTVCANSRDLHGQLRDR